MFVVGYERQLSSPFNVASLHSTGPLAFANCIPQGPTASEDHLVAISTKALAGGASPRHLTRATRQLNHETPVIGLTVVRPQLHASTKETWPHKAQRSSKWHHNYIVCIVHLDLDIPRGTLVYLPNPTRGQSIRCKYYIAVRRKYLYQLSQANVTSISIYCETQCHAIAVPTRPQLTLALIV